MMTTEYRAAPVGSKLTIATRINFDKETGRGLSYEYERLDAGWYEDGEHDTGLVESASLDALYYARARLAALQPLVEAAERYERTSDDKELRRSVEDWLTARLARRDGEG
jgi:hypothetical protein